METDEAGIDAETWTAITAARKEEQDAEAEVAGLKEALKGAKERLDVASAKLGRLIDEATGPNLFRAECPVCNNDTLEEGERVDVGFGGGDYGVKVAPDRCHACGYVEQGSDPDDKPIEHYRRCWETQVDPHPPEASSLKRELAPEYAAWIEQNVKANGFGKCLKVSAAMLEAFPKLRLVRGTYFCLIWGPLPRLSSRRAAVSTEAR